MLILALVSPDHQRFLEHGKHEVVDNGDGGHQFRGRHVGGEGGFFHHHLETTEDLVDFGDLAVEVILRSQVAASWGRWRSKTKFIF